MPPLTDEDPRAADDDLALEVVVLDIEDSIDLHTFQPRDIPSVVEAYLEAVSERGFREVRIIHGRGKGVQRARVRQVLAESPLVIGFDDASAPRGGWGAQIVWLRRL
ncbi:MAG: Smr/MutS family protein [Polyangiaceae bacterium]|nr:Smr/MutS family protein [Polyangiaceae bacterium]